MCVLKGCESPGNWTGAMTAYNMVRSVIGKYKEASARRKEATDDETETSG